MIAKTLLQKESRSTAFRSVTNRVVSFTYYLQNKRPTKYDFTAKQISS